MNAAAYPTEQPPQTGHLPPAPPAPVSTPTARAAAANAADVLEGARRVTGGISDPGERAAALVAIADGWRQLGETIARHRAFDEPPAPDQGGYRG